MRYEIRLIKKYPNRRLYDTAISSYITLEDVKNIVLEGEPLKVVDAKTEEDLTNATLLQIIMELEAKGSPIFTQELLQNIIRFYGHSMQNLMSVFLEKSTQKFMENQQEMTAKMQHMLEKTPFGMMSDIVQKNFEWWQGLQNQFLQSFTSKNKEKP